MTRELVIIGGGPAGLSAAMQAYREGVRDILILERDRELGGILNQCIHSGFGLHRFGEELTGPEYAARYIQLLEGTSVEVQRDTMVIHLNHQKEVHCVSAAKGYEIIRAKAVILAMGCRERTRGAIALPGSRPAGIFTAGAAQRYLNMDALLVGRRVVILGSGDIGLIMARRMTLEGAKVLAVVELMPQSSGLPRNIVQCLQDFHIPLYLSHTVTDIRGRERVEQVVVSRVDENRMPIPGTEMKFDCDTLLLSVGLIPENELTREAGIEMNPGTNAPVVDELLQTSLEGIFACGNVLQVHDLVDDVSQEAARAGAAAARYLQPEGTEKELPAPVIKKKKQQQTVLTEGEILCTVCPKSCRMQVDPVKGIVTGNGCRRGRDYALAEAVNPTRILTTTVAIRGSIHPRLPVKTSAPIPKGRLSEGMEAVSRVQIQAPVQVGDIIIKHFLGTDAHLIACRTMELEGETSK